MARCGGMPRTSDGFPRLSHHHRSSLRATQMPTRGGDMGGFHSGGTAIAGWCVMVVLFLNGKTILKYGTFYSTVFWIKVKVIWFGGTPNLGHLHWLVVWNLHWLVVWNMNFIFPYIGNNHPNWLSYFSEEFKAPTSPYLDGGSLRWSSFLTTGWQPIWKSPRFVDSSMKVNGLWHVMTPVSNQSPSGTFSDRGVLTFVAFMRCICGIALNCCVLYGQEIVTKQSGFRYHAPTSRRLVENLIQSLRQICGVRDSEIWIKPW